MVSAPEPVLHDFTAFVTTSNSSTTNLKFNFEVEGSNLSTGTGRKPTIIVVRVGCVVHTPYGYYMPPYAEDPVCLMRVLLHVFSFFFNDRTSS